MTHGKTKNILSRQEPRPFHLRNEKGRGNCVVVCDHASNRIPKSLKNLGLGKKALHRHIAWDIGAVDVARHVAKALDAPLVEACYSRLVCDLNRSHDSAECIREMSDYVHIPGNTGLSAQEKKKRLNEIFYPYHEEVSRQVEKKRKGVVKKFGRQAAPLFLSIHSFTPTMEGKKRPWHIGVMWNHEEKLGRAVSASLQKKNPRLMIGKNQPYSMKELNVLKDTIGRHAESKGIPYIIVEFRQDLIHTKKGAEKYARIFLDALFPIVTDPKTYVLRKKHKK